MTILPVSRGEKAQVEGGGKLGLANQCPFGPQGEFLETFSRFAIQFVAKLFQSSSEFLKSGSVTVTVIVINSE